MRLAVLLVLCVGGCAHEETRSAAAACTIADVRWPAAENDYSKTRTADTLDKLSMAVRADRDAYRADPSGKSLGGSLSQLNTEMTSQGSPFVANNALQAATRLRQLDCAIQRGFFTGRNADVEHLYTEILGDVDTQLKLARQ